MKHILFGVAALALAGCSHGLYHGESDSAEAAVESFDYASVFAPDQGRPEADYSDYTLRKSQEVLAFTGVMPGMTVVEMEAGDGYYTELFASVVGSTGKVYQQNPAGFDSFLGDSITKRGHLVRLPQVEYAKSQFDAMPVGDGEADIVTWFLGPHELWFVPKGEAFPTFGDPEGSFTEIARVLKPGGVFIALDHMAEPGAPATTGDDTHRLDKAIVIAMAEAAGLTLVEESDVLANPEDDYSVNVFDPSVRRKTDRFLLKFRK